MKILQTSKSICAVWLVLAVMPITAQTKPDNTAVNKRDRNAGEATADQQKNNKSDIALTASIRKSLVADKSLSTYGHNVKIITQNGKVTLKGPVHSEAEINTIVAKAAEVTGDRGKIVNELSVKK